MICHRTPNASRVSPVDTHRRLGEDRSPPPSWLAYPAQDKRPAPDSRGNRRAPPRRHLAPSPSDHSAGQTSEKSTLAHAFCDKVRSRLPWTAKEAENEKQPRRVTTRSLRVPNDVARNDRQFALWSESRWADSFQFFRAFRLYLAMAACAEESCETFAGRLQKHTLPLCILSRRVPMTTHTWQTILLYASVDFPLPSSATPPTHLSNDQRRKKKWTETTNRTDETKMQCIPNHTAQKDYAQSSHYVAGP